MAKPLETHEEAVRRWLAQQRASGDSTDVPAAAARVYETMFQSLAPVIGAEAVGAMLVRSVNVTKARYPCLGGVLPETRPPRSHSQVARQISVSLSSEQPAVAAEAATALYAALLGLMTTMIGERVTWQIVKKAFAELGPIASKETE